MLNLQRIYNLTVFEYVEFRHNLAILDLTYSQVLSEIKKSRVRRDAYLLKAKATLLK
jgi:hypothetical protein